MFNDPNITLERNTQKVIKKALAEVTESDVKKRIQELLADSIDSAKHKSAIFHKKVARASYRKPYTTLGLAMLTGTFIGLALTKLIRKR